jgi:maleamate amidohydrolase
MKPRVWDRFLTEQDKAHVAARPPRRKGFGKKPALLLIDNYRWVVGDHPEPILEAIKTWPGSTGLAGWEGIKRIREVLDVAREVGMPVIHVTGLDDNVMPGWASSREGAAKEYSAEEMDRIRRKYDIVDELSPRPGEPVLHKSSPSAFWGTPLIGYLVGLGIDTVIVCGESTSGCVRASVVEGCTYRYRMIVVEEGVYDRHEAPHAINLFDMNQKYADVLPLEEVAQYMREWGAQQSTAAPERVLATAATGR